MSQYPVDTTDNLVEAVNYLLSGPVSLGQNFQGVSATANPANNIQSTYNYEMFTNAMTAPFTTSDTVTGNTVVPSNTNFWPQLSTIDYYPALPPGITLPNVAITAITPETATGNILTVDVTVNPIFVDVSMETETQFLFTTNGPTNPFANNQKVTVSGVTPAAFNGDYKIVDLATGPATTSLTLIRLDGVQTWPAYTTGGQISWQNQNIVTDLSAQVSVTGNTDRVFVTCQAPIKGFVFNPIYATFDPGTVSFTYELRIRRYKATNKSTLPNGAVPFPEVYDGYVWTHDADLVTVPYDLFPNPNIALDNYTFFKPDVSTFNNVIDSPGIGLFLYTFEVYINNPAYDPLNPGGTPNIIPIAMATYGFRSFTAQVIKQ